MAQRPPGISVVPGHRGIVALDTIVFLMTGITGLAASARLINVEISGCAVVLKPVPGMRLRSRKWYLFLRALGMPLISLPVHR